MQWILLFAFISVSLFAYGFLKVVYSEKFHMQNRIKQLKEYNSQNVNQLNEELQQPFIERIIKPFLNWVSILTQKILPIKNKELLEKNLTLAGNPWNLNTREFVSLHHTITVITAASGFSITYTTNGPLFNQILYTVGGFIFGKIIVDIFLRFKIKNRQAAISKELPDVLDLLTVSVEAGLGFDAALQKVIKKVKGPISIEFSKTLQEIKMGKTRREALKDLAERTGEEDLNTFITSLIQADQLGVSIANVLRIQSKQIRTLRRQRIEEKAMKAPVKMLIPMVFFIFPAIFIVLLGPAAIQMIENFK